MTMRREWVATCDEPGCATTVTAPTSWPQVDFGQHLNDNGWAAAPAVKETFCATHYRELEVPERAIDLGEGAEKFAAAMAEADEHARRRTSAADPQPRGNGNG